MTRFGSQPQASDQMAAQRKEKSRGNIAPSTGEKAVSQSSTQIIVYAGIYVILLITIWRTMELEAESIVDCDE